MGRTDFTGPALVRLLASLTQADVPGSRQVFAERLSHWVGWTDAIALSAALGSGAAEAASSPATTAPAPAKDSPEDHDAQRVRAALASSIADDNAWAAEPGPRASKASTRGRYRQQPMQTARTTLSNSANSMAGDGATETSAAMPTDYAPYRWRYLARQQAMDSAIAPLRDRLRRLLSARSPAMARLAAVDAVMERALGAQERSLLATVPALLERCFTRLRDGAADGWLQQFHSDLHAVLLAELDLRFLPIDSLLAALRQAAPAPLPSPSHTARQSP